MTSGIESNAGCAGVGFERPFACPFVPLTAGAPLVWAGMAGVLLRSVPDCSPVLSALLKEPVCVSRSGVDPCNGNAESRVVTA